MLHFPNAKINLGLFVTEKRADGYHNIETVFYPLPMLKDALEVLPATADTTLRISGRPIEGGAQNNLVWRAYQLIKESYPNKVSEIHIHLMKTIPMGAGLGGGSADGAFMLRLLDKFFNLDLAEDALALLALKLGSDCPFFIYNTPHFAMGRGEVLQPLDLDLSRYSIQVICPKIHVSTALAFSGISPRKAPFDLRKLAGLTCEQWNGTVFNDFESTVFKAYPELAAIKQKLYNEGALYASMSGSGSAIYGVFKEGHQSSLMSDNNQDVFYFE